MSADSKLNILYLKIISVQQKNVSIIKYGGNITTSFLHTVDHYLGRLS